MGLVVSGVDWRGIADQGTLDAEAMFFLGGGAGRS